MTEDYAFDHLISKTFADFHGNWTVLRSHELLEVFFCVIKYKNKPFVVMDDIMKFDDVLVIKFFK